MDLGHLPGYKMIVAAQYDARYASHDADAAAARRDALAPYLARVLDALALPDAGWHLDAGCGDGLCALAVARARPAMQVVGVDASPRALGIARAAAAKEGLRNAAFVEGDVEAPPEAAFDRVSALSILNLLPRKEPALAAWARVAAPGARLVLTDGFAVRGGAREGTGALSFASFTGMARRAGWRATHQEDLTRLVAKLTAQNVWPWPEYVRDGMRYQLVALQREPSPNVVERNSSSQPGSS